jgi:hypothetical protein
MPPAVKRKIDPVEDMHFRLDEIERKVDALAAQLTPSHIAAHINGMASQLLAGNKIDQSSALVLAIRELIEVEKKPVTRTGTVDLPSGTVRMTVTEQRRP